MATFKKALIGEEDLSIGSGTFTRATSTGGSATLTKIGIHTFAGLLNVLDYGAVGDGATDDTEAIQDAIDAAAASASSNSWAGDTGLHAVYFPCVTKGYLIQGQLIIPEGVALVGENFNGSRLWLNSTGWTSNTPKIRDYNFNGSTQSQQIVVRNLTFMPDPADFAAVSALSDCSILHFKKVVEFHLQDVRFVCHGYWATSAPYNYTYDSSEADGLVAMKFQECVGGLIQNVGVDRGGTAIYGLKDSSGSNSVGLAYSRIQDCYLYSQADYSIRLGASCKHNTIGGNVIDQPGARNTATGIIIELDGSADTEHNTIVGNAIRVISKPLVCDAHGNTITGNSIVATQSESPVSITGNLNSVSCNRIKGGSGIAPISVTGRVNYFVGNDFHSEASSAVTESSTGKDNIIVDHDRLHAAGKIFLRTKNVTLTTADTWYDLANIYMPSTYMAATIQADANILHNGEGMTGLSQTFLVHRATGDLEADEVEHKRHIVGSGSITSLEMQFVSVDSDNMKLQIKRTTGTSSSASAIVELTPMSQKSREQIIWLTDLNL